MTILIRLFASLREALGQAEFSLQATPNDAGALSVASLRKQLAQRGAEWSVLMDADIHAAVNQQMVDEDHLIQAGDEVAFFPPVTGG